MAYYVKSKGKNDKYLLVRIGVRESLRLTIEEIKKLSQQTEVFGFDGTSVECLYDNLADLVESELVHLQLAGDGIADFIMMDRKAKSICRLSNLTYTFYEQSDNVLNIPAFVTHADIGYFVGNESAVLNQFTLPDGLIELAYTRTRSYPAFILDELRIPASVVSIGARMFSVPYLSKCLRSSFGKVVFEDGSLTSLSEECFKGATIGELTLPVGLTSIGKETFLDTTLPEQLVLPDSVDSIYAGAFSIVKGMQQVVFGSRIVSLGEQCFSACSDLETIHLPDTVVSMGDKVFWQCWKLRCLHFTKGMLTIPSDMCAHCSSLEDVQNIEHVETIGENSFMECTALKHIAFGDNLKAVQKSAFKKSGLIDLHLTFAPFAEDGAATKTDRSGRAMGVPDFAKKSCADDTEDKDWSGIKPFTLQENNKRIVGEKAFAECANLKSLRITGGVMFLHDSAFRDCKALVDVDLSDSGIREICGGVFAGCTNIRSLKLPNSLAYVCENCFSGVCVDEVVLPKTLAWCKGIRYLCSLTCRKWLVYAGSAGERFCKEYGYNYEIVRED